MLPTSSQTEVQSVLDGRNEGRCVIETLCLRTVSEDGSLIQVDDVCMKASDEQTELKQAEWSNSTGRGASGNGTVMSHFGA